MLYFLVFTIQIALGIFIIFLFLAFVFGAPYVPSNTTASKAMIRLAKIKKGTRVYDLGCGDGRLLFQAAKLGAIASGCDINPFLVLFIHLKALILNQSSSVTAQWRDMWKADISKSDVVFVYLLPWKMKQLQTKLLKELKPGTLVISNSFIFPSWKPTNEDKNAHVYAFRIPKK